MYSPVSPSCSLLDLLMLQLVGARAKSNVILSPISVKLVLSMLYSGAGGATAEELSRVLHLEGANSTDRYVSILQSLAVRVLLLK